MAMDLEERHKLLEAQLLGRQKQQEKALTAQQERQDRAHQNALVRNQRRHEATEELRRLTEAAKGENAIEAMKLRHELDIENRQMDFQIEQKQTYLDLEKQTLESVISQRQTATEAVIAQGTAQNDLNIRIMEKIVELLVGRSVRANEHDNALESKDRDAVLEVEVFEKKERVMQMIRAENRDIDEKIVLDVLEQIRQEEEGTH